MLDSIAAFLVKGLNKLLHIMPIRVNLFIGRMLGGLVYLLSGKRARITYANLKAAFRGEKSPKELKRITRGVYSNIAQTFAELLSMTKFDKEYIYKYVNVRNLERAKEAYENPNGMIFLSAHFGNWELSTVASVMHGFKLYLLARDQKMKKLNELLNLLRESRGNVVVRKGMDIKNIFRLLRQGKSLGILADQNAGPSGELIDFIGRKASAATGPYKFAQKSGACVLPVFIHRVKGPYHEVVVEEPMVIARDEDIVPYMKKYNSLLEKHIRNNPEQWLWMHKRWKLTPEKTVLVLSDGKRGHLKQSLAIVKQIKKYRLKEGYLPEEIKVIEKEVRFKGKIQKGIFNVLAPVFAKGSQGKLRLLRWALTEESYKGLERVYADVIVSCGSNLSGVNLVLKAENYARSVAVLDPGKAYRRRYDIVVVPEHDIVKYEKVEDNVIVTDMAPNLIDREALAEFSSGDDVKCVGLLFGGDNTHFELDEDMAQDVAKGIRDYCEAHSAKVFATSSRRTKGAADKVLSSELKEVGTFISGSNCEDEHTVEEILSRSSAVVVSGESISMVSEAVSSRKPVIVFMPKKRTEKYTKYEKFVEGLRDKGQVSIAGTKEMREAISRAIDEGPKADVPDDDDKIQKMMYKLF